MQPTTVDIWGLDDVLDSDQPARIIGPWAQDPTQTLLQLGESGDGLIVVAATVAGRYVISKSAPSFQNIYEAHAGPSFMPPQHVAVDVEPKRTRKIPVGILYFGPPCSWAQEQIAKAFGSQATFISHADATDDDREYLEHLDIGEHAHLSIYIGVAEDRVGMAPAVLATVATLGELFGPIINPRPEQIEQAVSRIGTGELVELIVPRAASASA